MGLGDDRGWCARVGGVPRFRCSFGWLVLPSLLAWLALGSWLDPRTLAALAETASQWNTAAGEILREYGRMGERSQDSLTLSNKRGDLIIIRKECKITLFN